MKEKKTELYITIIFLSKKIKAYWNSISKKKKKTQRISNFENYHNNAVKFIIKIAIELKIVCFYSHIKQREKCQKSK